MTRQQRKKRQKTEPLADYIGRRSLEVTMEALLTGRDIQAAISDLMQSAELRLRLQSSKPQERAGVRQAYNNMVEEAKKAGVPTPEEYQERIIKEHPGLDADLLDDRLDAATPGAVKAMIDEAAAPFTSEADKALRMSTPKGGQTPTQKEIAEWIASGNDMQELEASIASLWGMDADKVKVTSWAIGGLMVWRDGLEVHAPAELLRGSVRDNKTNPLAILIRALQAKRPINGTPNLRDDRILPAKIGMVSDMHPREGRLRKRFNPAAHRRGLDVLPGFESVDNHGPALPLALYQLGIEQTQKGGGPGAPLPLRIFIEAVLAVNMADRRTDRPVVLNVTLRDLLDRLYPGPRRPRPGEYWPRLVRAVEALDSMDARFPWLDPETGRGGLRRVVSVGDIPRGPDALADQVRIIVDLPPGSGDGPVVSPNLGLWGTRSAAAYNALLNLAFRWYVPGVTRHPVAGGRFWLQSQDPERYPILTDSDVVAVTRPLSARAARRNLVVEGWETLRELEAAGELRIVGGRAIPPLTIPTPRVTLARAISDVSPCRLGTSPRLTYPDLDLKGGGGVGWRGSAGANPRRRPGARITPLPHNRLW